MTVGFPNNSDFLYQFINNAGIQDFNKDEALEIYKTLIIERKKDGLITPAEIHNELLINLI